MSLRPALRAFRILGVEASDRRVAFHLKDDTPLDPEKAMGLVATPGSPWRLTPDMKLTRRIDDEPGGDAIDRVRETLRAMRGLLK
jgi:transcription-repair coupling factor (superfamily II helicase)